ncbi:hypothetical protein E2C01_086993 [Portunus trituberculatus]|uniref:Chitin-binding type-2 domain-containing protein n=2 Tax=Portunus trituberculatus TaxID=210409 RepID=A0A5B7JG45_PORTR|nr:hypothetical protein [Portunus trituberculatus]
MCPTPAPVGPMPPSVRPMPPSVRPMPPSLRPILPSSPTLMPPMLSPPPVCPDSVRRHFPASDSCSSFYECRKGVAERRECPDNLLYNVDSHHTRYPCDYFYNVVCVLQSPPSGSFPHPQQQQQRHYELDQHKKIFNFYTYVTNKW